MVCQDHDNIYVDMSQAYPFDIKTFIREVGIERITYGSDAPYQSPRVEQEKLRVIGLSEMEQTQVFWTMLRGSGAGIMDHRETQQSTQFNVSLVPHTS